MRTGEEESTYSERNHYQYDYVHHKLHVDYPESELGPQEVSRQRISAWQRQSHGKG